MACKICCVIAKPTDPIDCFEKALESLKTHYEFYKNNQQQLETELQKVNERNEQLTKALALLQKPKRFKANRDGSWLVPPNNSHKSNNSSRDEVLTDISLMDEDAAVGPSDLNMALNSEQLFEASFISPYKAGNASITSSEIISSPRDVLSPHKNKLTQNVRTLKDRNKMLDKSKPDWHSKETSSQANKSWALSLLKTGEEKKSNISTKKPERRLNLSLKKTNPSKVKQSILPFNKVKDTSLAESGTSEEIISASPVICKNSKAGRSWAHRSIPNRSTNDSNFSLSKTTSPKKDDTSLIHDNQNSPIEKIVFDFSPTKKKDSTIDSNSTSSVSNLRVKTTLFEEGNESVTDCVAMPNDITTFHDSDNSSSVVILTPRTQDIIFIDDSHSEFNINTLDLMADLDKQETEYMQNLKQIESKSIGKQQKQDTEIFRKPKTPCDTTKLIKPATVIKHERISDADEAGSSHQKHESSTSKSKVENPLIASEEEEEEEEDEHIQPIIKQELKNDEVSTKRSIKERFNIDCDECERYIKFCEGRLSDREIEEHLKACTRHKQKDIMRQNTPDDFWNPFILSFQTNDPRNEVLIDTRFRDKK